MFVMIDNYDSFVHNLARYLEELGETVECLRNDAVSLEALARRVENGEVEGILISPGPGRPQDGGCSAEVVRQFSGAVPILGVCLGHQIIGHVYGARVEKGTRPMHGKVTPIRHRGEGLFAGLPREYPVTRYHSLVVKEEGMPKSLQIEAKSADGAVMGIRHRSLPVYGVQFHPEAVLTGYGHELLRNFVEICRKFHRENRRAG